MENSSVPSRLPDAGLSRGVTIPAMLVAIAAATLALAACDETRKSAPSSPVAPGASRAAVAESIPTSSGTPDLAGGASLAERSDAPLLSLSTSAYQASLAVDRDVAYVLTSHAAYRLAPGRPADAMRVELGFGSTATPHGFVFWDEGAVREASQQDGEIRSLGTLAVRPQFFVSSGDHVAWIERSEDRRFSVGSLASQRASTVYTSPGSIDAATMLDDWVFFVERPTDTEWRIGGVRTKGGARSFTAARRGRSPSMLAAHGDVYYYDGNERVVRRLSPDLQREETLVFDFVCSPLAVAARVYCANVEGIFELAAEGRPRPLVRLERGAMVTELAANARRVFWIGDAGADRLVVRSIALQGD